MEDGGTISREAIEEIRERGAGRLMKMPYPPKVVDGSPRACRDGTRVAQLLRQAKEWRSEREMHENGVSRYEFKGGEVLTITRIGDALEYAVEGPAKEPAPVETRAERDQRIADMAAAGHSAAQIASAVGVGEDHVRRRVVEMGGRLGDAGIAKTRKVDPNRIVEEAASTLDGLLSAFALVDMSGLDQARAGTWASSMRESMKGITRFVREMESCL